MDAETQDIVQMISLSTADMVHILKARSLADCPYTMCGAVCIAVNPHRPLSHLYSNDVHHRYAYAGETHRAHPYIIAARALNGVVRADASHTIVITGESGAGKTEMSKICLTFASRCARANRETLDRIIDTGRVLEYLGNAQTTRNANSSRFGKFLQVYYLDGLQTGAAIRTYLLERGRIAHPLANEGTFRIVYAILDDLHDKYALYGFDRALLGNQRAAAPTSWTEFANLTMQSGFSMEQVHIQISEPIVAILFLLMRDFASAANMLQIDTTALTMVMQNRRTRVNGEVFWTECSTDDFKQRCKALAMALYQRTFSNAVEGLNKFVGGAPTSVTALNVLDIFGFESLQVNGLEQLCINYCNERIQNLFLGDVIVSQRAEYIREGVSHDDLDVAAAQTRDIVVLCDKALFPLLDETMRAPGGSAETYVQHASDTAFAGFRVPLVKQSGHAFIVDHYADAVTYTADSFLDRNRDDLRDEVLEVLCDSSHACISRLFPQPEAPNAKMWSASVVKTFSAQMADLMKTISQTTSLYIRCIRPNSQSLPDLFDDDFVSQQIRANGLVQAAQVMRGGYSHKMQQCVFNQMFRRCGKRMRAQLNINPARFYWGKVTMVYMTHECFSTLLREEAACALTRAATRMRGRRALQRLQSAMCAVMQIRKTKHLLKSLRNHVAAESNSRNDAVVRIQRVARMRTQQRLHRWQSAWRHLSEIDYLKRRVEVLKSEIKRKDEWIFHAKQQLCRHGLAV